MHTSRQDDWQKREPEEDAVPLALPLSSLNYTWLPLVGGKAANLGELMRAGFSVPAGFCVTTAAYACIATRAGLDTYLSGLETTSRAESTRQIELATAIRTALCETPLPTEVIEAVTSAYQALGQREPVPVAVRSSATAEDLPEASFAGQQDTYLNMIGIEAVLTAVQRCFASLWTDRATQYRASLGIAPQSVRLAVVIQRMVDALTAGVLFTANPLTGKRRQAVIEANPGLGEAVVSGMTNPDHFVVDTETFEIIERRLGDLSEAQVRTLSALGAEVEAHFGLPQDIEWAIDTSGQTWLLQARPITTLFPLPSEASSPDEHLRVYLAFGVQQGTYRPFTPMGRSALGLIASGFLVLIGLPPRDPLAGPRFIVEAASRPFFDVTRALRSSFGRRFLMEAMEEAETHAAIIFQQLVTDPRLSLLKTPRRAFVRALMLLLVRTRLPWYLLQALVSPRAARGRVQRFVERLRNPPQREKPADAEAHLAEASRLLLACLHLAFRVSPVMLAGMQTFALAKRLLGDQATEGECQIVLRGSPSNPTTRMNLALWHLSEQVRADQNSRYLLQHTPATQLAQDYQQGRLPALLQQGLEQFLHEYGHQGVCELDLGVPRWAEDPTYVLGLLKSLQEMGESAQAPDLQFQRAAEEARAIIATLSRRAVQQHRLRGRLAGWCLRRAHALAGFREMPRFVGALQLAQARAHLVPVGEELARMGRLAQAADIFFLTLPEVHETLAGADLRESVRERHATFVRELTRHHVPLVLLSDGTEPPAQSQSAILAAGALQGTPASPGVVTAPARVILDPHDARLSPGEILVAPSTDPGWTPLFLKASGLVMEMGGAMAHGAIVAREYGIPAVVGVAQATERIVTGSRITVDGTTGTIRLEQQREE